MPCAMSWQKPGAGVGKIKHIAKISSVLAMLPTETKFVFFVAPP